MSKSCCKPENIAMSFVVSKGALPLSLLPISINQEITNKAALGTAVGSFISSSGKSSCAILVVSLIDIHFSFAKI
ncbi:hypothetical protein D3C80_2177600 [compost metagenome]